MPSRSQYALMSSKDRNAVLFICFSSAVAFFDFLIYLYLADIIAAAFFPANTSAAMAKTAQSTMLFQRLKDVIFFRYVSLYVLQK